MVELLAVAGRPIMHSLSPGLFARMFASSGIEGCYFRISASDPAVALRCMKEIGLRGMNMTSPLKQRALEVAHADPESRAIGATNCLVAGRNGVSAHNTDWKAVYRLLEQKGPPGGRCLVLGAGGAASAAAYAAVRAGYSVLVANRTESKAGRLAERLKCDWAGMEGMKSALANADVLISCLPDGVEVGGGSTPPKVRLVIEAAYHRPSFGEAARAWKARYVSGRTWLAMQARYGFRTIFGIEPPLEPLLSEMDRTAAPPAARPVALVGFMGSGKSTVGRLLAGKLGVEFADTDEMVEAKAGMTAADVFSRLGEPAFRGMEREQLERLAGIGPAVVACGGGAVLHPDNRRLLKRHFTVVWLWADTETTSIRLAGTGRPLLGPESSAERIEKLARQRASLYAEVCDLLVPTGTGTAGEVAEVIADEIRSSG